MLDHVPDMNRKPLSELGKEAKIRIGKQTDDEVLAFVDGKPGLTLYEISKALGWSVGKVQGSIDRLEAAGELTIEKVLREGRVANLIYPKEQKISAPGTIRIDRRLLNTPDEWKGQVNALALNRSTIIISPSISHELEDNALFKTSLIPDLSDNEIITVVLPEKMVNFYQLQNSNVDTISDGRKVFVTIKPELKALISPEENQIKPEEQSPYRVLLMEDEQAYALKLQHMLSKYFSSVELAYSESDVKRKIEKNKPDFLILDWDIKNLKAAERIYDWAKDKGYNIPAIVITGQEYDDEDKIYFKNKGFDDFFDKATSRLAAKISSRIQDGLRMREASAN